MRFLIESYGYRVIGRRGRLLSRRKPRIRVPGLILMDMAMPVMDGIDAARAVRKLKQGTEVPIIAVTMSKRSPNGVSERRLKIRRWDRTSRIRPF
jgi:CheY-like chemotaxis protein